MKRHAPQKITNEKKTKGPIEDLEAKAQKCCDNTRRSLRIRLINKKRGFVEGSDNEPDSKENFKHGARKKHEIVNPRDTNVSLKNYFFNDVELCSIKQANLDDILSFSLLAYHLSFLNLFTSTG